MEIIKNFGFEPVFFIAQIVNFLILAAIFKKYLYKPVLNMLKNREQKIADGLRDAEIAQKALVDTENKKDEIIRDAALQAEKIIEETKKSAEELRESLTSSAKSEAERIISQAHEASKIEFENAQRAAEEFSLDLSRKLLDKVIDKIFTKPEKAKIMQRNLKLLEEVE